MNSNSFENMSGSLGAQAAFKGYYSQTLYILSRVLAGNNDLVFQPEKEEDLAVYDNDGNLIEVVQVKDYSKPLALSDFGKDFFSRCRNYTKTNTPIRVVSFGLAGPELKNISKNNGNGNSVKKKLIDTKGFSSEEADKFLKLLSIEEVEESQVKGEIEKYLKGKPFATYQKDLTLKILTHKIFMASFEQSKIKYQDIIECLKKIVEYINRSQDFLNTFGKNIVEIFNNELLADNELKQQRQRYQAEYYVGVSARPEHIKADVDVIRKEKIRLIERYFKEKNIVIIHGASGQGKSSLAYRFLFECQPISYEIKNYNSSNFLDILSALKQFTQTLEQQIPIYLDVQPGDSEWLKLAQELSRYPEHFKVLVSIREEDWNMTAQGTFSFEFKDIELAFDKDEAEKIFTTFEKYQNIKSYPTFEDAWLAYGEKGPLLEFVYLLSQGETLEKRLSAQMRNPKYSGDHKKLLRLISFAGQYEASINTKNLFDVSDLTDDIFFNDILTFFENEYLIRRVDERQIVALHPIRATLLAGLLINETTCMQDVAVKCIDVISEEGVEIFLKYYFLDYPDENEEVVEHLYNRAYRNWIELAGVLRALLWLGAYRYMKENKHLVERAFEKVGMGWYFMAPVDFLKLRSDLSENIESLVKASSNYDFYTEILSQYTDTFDALHVARNICLKMKVESLKSVNSGSAIISFSEILFWLGYFNIKKNIDFNKQLNFEQLMKLELHTLSYVFLGFYEYSRDVFDDFKEEQAQVVKRFKLEYDIPWIEESEEEVKMHCLPSENSYVPDGEDDDGYWMVMTRLDIARRIFPGKEYYATEGYGYSFKSQNMDFDSTKKRINRKYLPIEWYNTIGHYFTGLGTFNFRPKTWEEYFENVFNYIGTIESFVEFLTDALASFLAKEQFLNDEFFEKYNELAPYNHHKLLFHKGLVDKFGKITESKDFKNKEVLKYPISYAIKKHLPLKDALAGLSSYLDNFSSQAYAIFRLKHRFNNRNDGEYKNKVNLSLSNLQDAIRYFGKLYGILETVYSKYFNKKSILTSDRLCYFFGLFEAFVKSKKRMNAQEIKDKIKKYESLPDILFEKAKRLKNLGLTVDIKQFERDLFFVANVENVGKYFNVFEILVKKLRGIIGHHNRISLKRTVLEFLINDIYIIPVYKNKILLDEYKFKVNLFSLFYQDTLKRDPLFNLAYNLKIGDVQKRFEQARWRETYPELGHFQVCIERLSVLSRSVTFFSEVASLSTKIGDDEIGFEMIKSRLEKASSSELKVQTILDDFALAVNIIIEKFENLTDEKKRFVYTEGLKPLENFSNEFLPVEHDANAGKQTYTIELNRFPDWSKKLKKGIKNANKKLLKAITVAISIYEDSEGEI